MVSASSSSSAPPSQPGEQRVWTFAGGDAEFAEYSALYGKAFSEGERAAVSKLATPAARAELASVNELIQDVFKTKND